MISQFKSGEDCFCFGNFGAPISLVFCASRNSSAREARPNVLVRYGRVSSICRPDVKSGSRLLYYKFINGASGLEQINRGSETEIVRVTLTIKCKNSNLIHKSTNSEFYYEFTNKSLSHSQISNGLVIR